MRFSSMQPGWSTPCATCRVWWCTTMKVKIAIPDCRGCPWQNGSDICLLPRCFRRLMEEMKIGGESDGRVSAGAGQQRRE